MKVPQFVRPLRRPEIWIAIASCGLGCALVLFALLFLPLAHLVASVGVLVAILIGVVMAQSVSRSFNSGQPSLLENPFLLARDAQVLRQYQAITESLVAVTRQSDSIYREIALEHLDELARRAAAIAEGTFVFEGTETWRIVYERLLRSPGLHLYRSVAWIKNASYWQDEPGRKSMAVNFELHAGERLNIERIAIIADELWRFEESWPAELLRQWLHEQHVRGIWVKFVRQSALVHEPDLIADIGIYGSRAIGVQELDEHCRTVRFTLAFDFKTVAAAEERWKRLAVYAESFASYLDRYEMP